MPAVNDSIPTYDSAAAYTQQDSLLTDSLTVKQLTNAQADSAAYSGKPVAANEIYGVKSTLPAKPATLYTTGEGVPREHPLGSSWAYLPVIGVLLLALLLLRYTRGYLSQLLLLLVSYKKAHKQYKGSLQNFNRSLLALVLFSTVPTAILITYLLYTFPSQLTIDVGLDYKIYLTVGCLFLGISMLRSLILLASGALTYEEKLIKELRYNGRVFLSSWGIIVLPFVILLAVSNSEPNKLILFYIIISISILLYILYLLRSFQLFFSEKVSIFFWILYLCMFELLPMILVFDYLFPFR